MCFVGLDCEKLDRRDQVSDSKTHAVIKEITLPDFCFQKHASLCADVFSLSVSVCDVCVEGGLKWCKAHSQTAGKHSGTVSPPIFKPQPRIKQECSGASTLQTKTELSAGSSFTLPNQAVQNCSKIGPKHPHKLSWTSPNGPTMSQTAKLNGLNFLQAVLKLL